MGRRPTLPAAIKVGGDKYRATVVRVVSRDPDGSPRGLELLRDDQVVGPGDELEVVFCPASLAARRE